MFKANNKDAIAGLPMNGGRVIALARAHTRQYLFGRAIVARAKLYMTS